MDKKFGFIGVGNMATAIICGILKSNYTSPENICIFDKDDAKCNKFSLEGVCAYNSIKDVVLNSDIIVLAVKPQNYSEVLTEISQYDIDDKIFVSIAAGISVSYIREILKKFVKVVRVMPNTPLLLSKGATALCPSTDMTSEDYTPVVDMFALGGVVEIIDESHMNQIISINGSSPAYVYLFAKAMVEYADECGIDRAQALNLVCATFEGASLMMKESGDDLDTLISKVSSPGGTTIASLNSFEENKFVSIIKTAMKACTDRAEELSK